MPYFYSRKQFLSSLNFFLVKSPDASTLSLFDDYKIPQGILDEALDGNLEQREHYQKIFRDLSGLSKEQFNHFHELAKDSFFTKGITFNVYSDTEQGVEKIFPFDLMPRVIPEKEWETMEKGLLQRSEAVNRFVHDLYHDQKILKEKVIPADLVLSCQFFLKEMKGFDPVGGVYVHISGTDLIKHKDNNYYVLEDNLRCPSGVSYVHSNRQAMKRLFSGLLQRYKLERVEDYGDELLATMQSVAPEGVDNPTCLVLTPGAYNSAYYEHSFLALSMGVPLAEGRDLYVEKGFVYMKTVQGPVRVDVIYRRVDDDFMDPKVFRKDSVLGVPGIMEAYKQGNVTLINAPGTGVADDKAVYPFMPEIIKYYLGEEPILKNVETYRCTYKDELQYVLDNMDKLVVKPVDESGGYGVMIGSKASKKELEECRERVLANPRKYIGQPIMSLSTIPSYIHETDSFEPRHVDLRAFTLKGKGRDYVLKGGLTRVALKRGSLIVNSSQGGGSKDTWVMGSGNGQAKTNNGQQKQAQGAKGQSQSQG